MPLKAKKIFKCILIQIGIGLLFIVLLEGLMSCGHSFRFVVSNWKNKSSSKTCCEYDPYLGWTVSSDLNLKNFFGEGKDLTTNSLGFRNTASSMSTRVNVDKIKGVSCIGDSFTFGEQVGDFETWCSLLGEKDSSFRTVNLGVPSFGIDQSYLRYERDGNKIRSDIIIFSFIFDDFERMRFPTRTGLQKPLFLIQDKKLLLSNIPVPSVTSSTWFRPNLLSNLTLFDEFRAVKVSAGLLAPYINRLSPTTMIAPKLLSKAERDLVLTELMLRIKSLAEERHSFVIFAWLPDGSKNTFGREPFEANLKKIAFDNQLTYFDLETEASETFYNSTPRNLLFDMTGHLTALGNELTADAILQKMHLQ